MTSLLPVRLSPLLLGLAILAPCDVRAQLKYVPFPTKSELRSLQLLAYTCSRENTADICTRTREIDRMWRGAELGITPHLQRKLERQRIRCGDGEQR